MTAVRDELVRTLAEAVVTQVADRGDGHCLIVPHLPQPIADGACRLVRDRLAGGDARDHARTVVERPEEDWQASPTKAVATALRGSRPGRRNPGSSRPRAETSIATGATIISAFAVV